MVGPMARSFIFDGADPTGRVLGPVLTRWRRDLDWTQDELAGRAGISRGYLSRLERGLPGRPGLDVLTRVCGAMGRSWTELYAAAGLALPGDVTLDAIGDGLDDPELLLYLRRLPELDPRDLAVLRALLRAFFDRRDGTHPPERPDSRQLALLSTTGESVPRRR
ncbi:MAG TPA: hypothetical protein DEU95_08105 [Chloroflexi bacterium]|nr:hypothetical protein [Chloroflexota bacterium]